MYFLLVFWKSIVVINVLRLLVSSDKFVSAIFSKLVFKVDFFPLEINLVVLSPVLSDSLSAYPSDTNASTFSSNCLLWANSA